MEENYEKRSLEWFRKRVYEEIYALTPNSHNDGPMFVKCINQAQYYYNLQERHNYQFFDLEEIKKE